jgi:hypothetical protein
VGDGNGVRLVGNVVGCWMGSRGERETRVKGDEACPASNCLTHKMYCWKNGRIREGEWARKVWNDGNDRLTIDMTYGLNA